LTTYSLRTTLAVREEGGVVPTVHARALKRAAEILGGSEQLAVQLGVVPSHLARWIEGTVPTPTDIFLKVVDLISEHDAPKH
jgi:hypothetical protein